MNRTRSARETIASLLPCLIFASLAQAQATRTWVSGVGDDANPCSRTAPCKTFAGAISKTAAGGEISVLDPGGFGAVTITKAITINGDGTLAGILAAGTNGIIVNAGVNDVVIIRGISINGANSGLSGIRFLAGKHLHVESCTISNFQSFGIEGANASAAEMSISDCSFTKVNIGIRVSSAAGNLVSIDNVRINRNNFGIDALGGVTNVFHSVISHTNQSASSAGVVAEGTSILNVSDCTVTNNSIGMEAFTPGSTLRFSNCTVHKNTTGIFVAGGATCDRFGNSAVFGNTTDISGVTTLRALQ